MFITHPKNPSKAIRNQLCKEFFSTSSVLQLLILRENRCPLFPGWQKLWDAWCSGRKLGGAAGRWETNQDGSMRINVDVGRSVKFDLRLILETSNLSIVNLFIWWNRLRLWYVLFLWSSMVSRSKILKMQTKSQSTFDCRFFRLNYWWMPCMMVSQRCRRVLCNPISIGLRLPVICPTWLCSATRVPHGHSSSQWRLNNTIAMACCCCRTCSRWMLVLWNYPQVWTCNVFTFFPES